MSDPIPHDLERAYNASREVKHLASVALARCESNWAAELTESYDVLERYARHLRDEAAAKLKAQTNGGT